MLRIHMASLSALLAVVACGGQETPPEGAGARGQGGSDAAEGSGGTTSAGGAAEGGSGGSTGAGGAPGGPGCTGLAASCGPAQDDDCCARTTVQGGTFLRSYDGVSYGDDSHPATVSDFELDVYPVTVGRFRAFLEAGMGTQQSPPEAAAGAHPLIADSGWFSGWDTYLAADSDLFRQALACKSDTQTWSDAPDPARETLPINCLTWFEAFAFCAWDGGRLPTEAEWNYAAAGGDEQREYPWGSGLDDTLAAYECLGDGASGCDFTDILPVGFYSPAGDGRWGQTDLAGNQWEYVRDWYAPYEDPCVDCANTTPSEYNVVRGGSWGSPPAGLLAANRKFVTAAERSPETGFRCARTP